MAYLAVLGGIRSDPMIDLVASKTAELEQLCKQFRVRRLELFGSAAGASCRPDSSDLDFLVEYLPLKSGAHADAYFGLLEALEHLFGRNVDLVMVRAIRNRYFLEEIASSRTTLYAA